MKPIEEYLAVLGFKVDEASWSKFNLGLIKGAAGAAQLGASVAAAALTVSAAVGRIAQQYNDLYYVSQRTNSAVQNLKGFEYGASAVGVAYDQARAAVEGFAAAVRMNPGLGGLMRGMGINPNDSQAAATAFIGRMKKQFGEGQYFVAARFAQLYGIDEHTFKQLWTNYDVLIKKQQEYGEKVRQSGVDMQGLAEKSRNFTNATDSMLKSMELIGDQVAAKWLPSMTEGVQWIDKMAQGLSIVGKNTEGWSSTIISLVASLGALKAAAWALSFIPGFGAVSAALGAPAAALGAIGAPVAALAGGFLLASTESTAGRADDEPMSKEYRRKHGAPSLMSFDPTSRREEAVRYFMSQGWSRAQAIGIAANLDKESGFDASATGDGGKAYGVAQWHPDRQAKFRQVFGKDIRQSTYAEQLAFVQWELQNSESKAGTALRGATTAGQAGAAFSSGYERPAGGWWEAQHRARLAERWADTALGTGGQAGGANVTIQQKTDIHVDGTTDPAGAAKRVLDGQDRVNGDIVRNTKGAVR